MRKTKRKKIDSWQPVWQSIAPTRNQCWSASFVREQLTDGGYYCILVVVDQSTTECVALEAIPSMHGVHIAAALDGAIEARGVAPMSIILDGNELAGETLGAWADRHEVRLLLECAGGPRLKSLIERFHGRLQDECLKERFGSLREVREGLACWRRHYNEVRPRSTLGKSNSGHVAVFLQAIATPAKERK